MRVRYLSEAWMMVVLMGCALPGIYRESAQEQSERDAGMDAGKSDAGAPPPKNAGTRAASDAGKRREERTANEEDAGVPLDPKLDPANRYEDFVTFLTLLPPNHLFAEWPMPDSSPNAKVKPDYAVEEHVIVDNVTALRWQRVVPDKFSGCQAQYPLRGQLQEVGTGCTWEEAKAYCLRPEIAEELGPGEWRLPTKIELESIMDVTRPEAFDPVFTTYPTDFFWSASPFPNPDSLKLAWAVDFSDGYSYPTARYKGGRVRCVASASKTGGRNPDYMIVGDVVEDHNTLLVWQHVSDSEARSWNDALRYCETLELAGGGWRLPYLKELLTLVDPTRNMGAIEPRTFGLTPHARFWTASVFVDNDDEAYQVEFTKGGVTYSSMVDEHFVRCVR